MKAAEAVGAPEQEQRPHKFHPEKDITDQDYEWMKNWVDHYVQIDQNGHVMRYVALLTRTNLNRGEIQQLLTQADLEKLASTFDYSKQHEIVAGNPHDLGTLYALSPKQRKTAPASKLFRQKLDHELLDISNRVGWFTGVVPALVEEYMAIFPGEAPEINIPETNRIQQRLERALEPGETGRWKTTCTILYALRLMNPEVFQQINITPEHWQSMNDELDWYRSNNNQDAFIDLAHSMAVISAENVEIDENGNVQLTWPEEELSQSQTLPERPAV